MKTYLDTLSLPAALFWFIENVSDDTAERTELFFYLRERVRNANRDPIAFAAREFLDTIAEHRHTLSSEHRRHLDRIAGNIRKIA